MNRYKQEIDVIDRQHRTAVRLFSFAGAAVLVALVIWGAGWSPVLPFLKRTSVDHPAKVSVASRPIVSPVATTHVSVAIAADERVPGTDSSISPVPLELLLVATQVGSNVHEGLAFIGVDRLHPQTYVAGATLENGARLEEIYRERVVLEKNGHRATMVLQSQVGGRKRNTKPDSLVMVGGPVPQIEQRHLSADVMSDYVRVVPEYTNGIIAGFEVYPGAHSTVFNQWALKAGDVIEALDGAPLMEANQLRQQFNEILGGAVSMATVRRNGKTIQIALDGAAIAQLRAAHATTSAPLPAVMP